MCIAEARWSGVQLSVEHGSDRLLSSGPMPSGAFQQFSSFASYVILHK